MNFKGIKLWPGATGNILMMICIILLSIIVIGGLTMGITSQKNKEVEKFTQKTPCKNNKKNCTC